MKTISIGEFVEHIDEILRLLKDRDETIYIVDQGDVVARLLPPLAQQSSSSDEVSDKAWANLERLSAEVGKRWTNNVDNSSSQQHDKHNSAAFLDMLNHHTNMISA